MLGGQHQRLRLKDKVLSGTYVSCWATCPRLIAKMSILGCAGLSPELSGMWTCIQVRDYLQSSLSRSHVQSCPAQRGTPRKQPSQPKPRHAKAKLVSSQKEPAGSQVNVGPGSTDPGGLEGGQESGGAPPRLTAGTKRRPGTRKPPHTRSKPTSVSAHRVSAGVKGEVISRRLIDTRNPSFERKCESATMCTGLVWKSPAKKTQVFTHS